MKKFSFAKIASLVLAFTMLLGALTVTVLATEEPTVEIVSNNVYYGEKYQLMYAVNAPAGATVSAKDSEGNAIKVVSFEEEPTQTFNGVECDVYVLAEGVAAQAIDEVITFTVEYNGVTATSNYSVLQYVYERLNVKNIAQGEVKTMLEALLTFASAANKVIDKDNTSFSDYKYVTVVDGTLDGDNVAGMFLPNATPFANIVATPDYDTSAYNVEWSVSVDGADAVIYDNDEIKSLAITGNTVVTRVLVESECQHVWSEATCTVLATCSKCGATTGELLEHAWTDATCEAPKTCDNCGATEGEVADHADNDGDLACDTCGKVLAETVTITFNSTDKCISSSTTQQVWTENGIVFTNDKASSQTNVAVYTPIRCYANSTVSVEFPSMNKIIVNCNSASYATALASDVGEAATVNGKAVTIILSESADMYKVTLSAQVRIDSIVVYAAVCSHENTYEVEEVPATCTKTGTTAGVMCSDCGRVVSGVEEIEMADHTEVEIPAVEATCGEAGSTAGAKCSVCGTVTVPTTNVPATGEHADDDEDGLCDVCDHEMGTPDAPAEPETLATFELGANGTASHYDGTEKTSYSETVNGYTLSIGSCSKMYTGARDAKGNSCIKFGTSSTVGTCTITVPDNVTKVIIYVAKYKANTTKISVNGTAHTLTKNSNDGEYDTIEIDTTTNKTISFATVSGGARAMLNTIEFIGYTE